MLRVTLYKKWSFPLRISSVNVTKFAVSWGRLEDFIFRAVLELKISSLVSRFIQNAFPYFWHRQPTVFKMIWSHRAASWMGQQDIKFWNLEGDNQKFGKILLRMIYCSKTSLPILVKILILGEKLCWELQQSYAICWMKNDKCSMIRKGMVNLYFQSC